MDAHSRCQWPTAGVKKQLEKYCLNFQTVPPKLVRKSPYQVVTAVAVNGDKVSSYGTSGSKTS